MRIFHYSCSSRGGAVDDRRPEVKANAEDWVDVVKLEEVVGAQEVDR